MSQLNQSLMIETAKTRFRSYNLKLDTIVSTGRPPNLAQFLVKPPGTSTGSLAGSLAGAVPRIGGGVLAGAAGGGTTPARPTGTPLSVPPALIKAASNDKADVDFQTEVNNELTRFIEGACQAVVFAHTMWKITACLRGVLINGPIAVGGRIDGPSLAPLIKSQPNQSTMFGLLSAYTKALADGLDSCWQLWQSGASVPSLPWYPGFAAVPAPTAPPTPNIPTPLMALNVNGGALSASSLEVAMKTRIGPAPYTNEMFASLGAAIATAVSLWLPSQMVMNVLGQGPCPMFAPPYVPVSPVVNGSIIEAPGHFAS